MNAKRIEVVKILDCTSPDYMYMDNWDWTMRFIKNANNHCYKELERNGILFLNEVYEILEIPKTRQGQVAGWTYDGMSKRKEPIIQTAGEYNKKRIEVRFFPLENILYMLREK